MQGEMPTCLAAVERCRSVSPNMVTPAVRVSIRAVVMVLPELGDIMADADGIDIDVVMPFIGVAGVVAFVDVELLESYESMRWCVGELKNARKERKLTKSLGIFGEFFGARFQGLSLLYAQENKSYVG